MPLDTARDAVIAMQATLIQALATENVRLAGQAADLAARVERVERVERLALRNSGNSSMPPSADDLPGRTPPQRGQSRERGKRKPGKQPGVPGSHLAWSEHPDDRVPHFPGGMCECRAAQLSAAGPNPATATRCPASWWHFGCIPAP
jgi:transposase